MNLTYLRSVEFCSLNASPVGLGTGGLRDPRASIEAAMRSEYRLLDLAREYQNEHIVGAMFSDFAEDDSFPRREEVFLVSKVWPTQLGFGPTTRALYDSMTALKTNYLDSYLLHWPAYVYCMYNLSFVVFIYA